MQTPLRITTRPLNIFVIGDLVVDHAIFVVNKTKPYHLRGNEEVFDVLRRVNTAGGAANCARILGALNRGNTYLWGVTGRSLWGAFSDVLEASEVSDVSASKVIVTGFHDQPSRMNTITRVIKWDEADPEDRSRFDDVGSLAPTQTAAESLLSQLKTVHTENHLDAIVLYDLDMNALDARLIGLIGDFAAKEQIPLFVDPKRTISKYDDVTATAIFPNIEEWCEIVGERHHEPSWWHREIERPDGLRKLAQRSLEHLSAFEYHVITFGKDGAVVIGAAEGKAHRVSVLQLSAHPTEPDRPTIDQLGCGDVVTAVSALQFVASDAPGQGVERMAHAVRVGNWVVAAYRQMSWGQMPRRIDIDHLKTPAPPVVSRTEFSATDRWLPAGDVDLAAADVRTAVPTLVSVDAKYRATLHALLENLRDRWDLRELRSVVLTAQGGSGKSQICAALPDLLSPHRIRVQPLALGHPALRARKASQFVEHFRAARGGSDRLLLIIDEAFKHADHLFFGREGVVLLDALHHLSVRLLMIDADFRSVKKNLNESQFLSRCDDVELPKLADRPADIAYVFLAGCARAVDGTQRFGCERQVLRRVIDFVLTGTGAAQSPRMVAEFGKAAFHRAVREGDPPAVRLAHLDEQVRGSATDADAWVFQVKC